MIEFFCYLDKEVFYFCNRTIANPIFDSTMPFITNWNQSWVGLSFAALFWLLLFWKGGKKGRIIALLLIPLITFSDQLSSSIIKPLVARPRPCHSVDGIVVLENIRLLVSCGSGFSFPSSHAVNNFAFATFISYYYRKWAWLLFTYAVIMGFSRLSVGVHYPSDVLAGAIWGACSAYAFMLGWKSIAKMFPTLYVAKNDAKSI